MADVLQKWLRVRLNSQPARSNPGAGPSSVTLLAYHFWEPARFDSQFDLVEGAVRETWAHCGMLKTVLVVNAVTPRLEAFAEASGGWVSLDRTDALVPGNIHSMSVDCNLSLHRRFDSEYVLVVQNDGFPLRPGLDAFVGKWDFIGAPYVRNTWRNRLVCGAFNCWVSNGGFSLRSKRICELASHYWKKKYFSMPDCRAVSEDIFYTETLPLRERAYRRSVRIADHAHALAFSFDAAFPYPGATPPFGFHGVKAFEDFLARGWVPEASEGGTAYSFDLRGGRASGPTLLEHAE